MPKVDGRNWESICKRLRRPFRDSEVYWRIDRVNGGKALLLCYVDARAIQDRLDNTVGPENWCVEHRICGDTSNETFICRLGIRINGDWVYKEDVSGKMKMYGNDAHEAKGSASTAFKRAAVMWGMARHLYDLGSTKVSMEAGSPPDDVSNRRVVRGKVGGGWGYAVAPSIQDVQFNLYSYDELVADIEQPSRRRMARITAVIRRECIEQKEVPQFIEAASAIWEKGSPKKRGLSTTEVRTTTRH